MQPPAKRAKTLANNPDGFSGESSVCRSGNEMEFLGSKGLVKKSEFIRIIIDALISLGFDGSAALLEEESGIPLHDSITKQFLELVKNEEWDKSIDALQGFELRDEKAVKFLLLEQKYLELVKMKKDIDAVEILKEKIAPLGVNRKRVHELAYKLAYVEDTETVISRSKVVEKLQNLFPPAVIFPKRRLEYLLEESLDRQRIYCGYHNVPDNDLSLCYDHRHCYYHKIPSETVQTLEEHMDEVWFLKFSHNGKYLASSSKDKSAIIWEIDAEGKFSRKHTLLGHDKPVVMVLWSPDDRHVITCGENEVIKCWDVDSGEYIQSYGRNGVGSVSCGWFHDGSGIIGGMADRSICLWTLDGIGVEQEHEQGQREQKLSDVAMTTDGKWIVSMGRAREISFCDKETFRVEKVIREEDMITSFSLSKDSKHILINVSTKGINLWSIEGDDPFQYHEYNGHKRSQFIIRSCFGGYEESFIASGSEDCQVYIWHRAESILPLRQLQGHTGAVKCVSWNPTDLNMLASASDDGTIRIWGLKQVGGEFIW